MQAMIKIFTVLVMASVALFTAPVAGADHMEEETLVSERVDTGDIPVSAPIATVEGRPSALPQMYDIVISAASGATNTVSVFTGGTVTESFSYELVNLGTLGTSVDLTVLYRHDPTQQVCLVALNGSCGGGLPFSPTNHGWLVGSPQVDPGINGLNPTRWESPSISFSDSGQAADAALIVSATVTVDDAASTTQRLSIPLVGQVVGAAR